MFIKNSMKLWKTTLEGNSRKIAQASIKCYIYQGDAQSPLLFCIEPQPIIAKSGPGYQLRIIQVFSIFSLSYTQEETILQKSTIKNQLFFSFSLCFDHKTFSVILKHSWLNRPVAPDLTFVL